MGFTECANRTVERRWKWYRQLAGSGMKKKAGQAPVQPAIAGPRSRADVHPWEASELPEERPGTDGFFTCPSLRQPGDHRPRGRRPMALRPRLSTGLPFRG